jgi:hypothetical protein
MNGSQAPPEDAPRSRQARVVVSGFKLKADNAAHLRRQPRRRMSPERTRNSMTSPALRNSFRSRKVYRDEERRSPCFLIVTGAAAMVSRFPVKDL